MNVAIIGSSGYIAGYIISRLNEDKNIDRIIKIDQTEDADIFMNLIEAEKFDYESLREVDYVIFTAAISGPDDCANKFDFCWSVNVTGTKHFISEAIKQNCKVLFFSSDAVFGDIPGKIYTEVSETNALTPYGRMKKAIEDEFKENIMFKAIRLSYVVSARDRFVRYCLGCVNDGKEAEVFHPFYRNCISVTDVVDVVQWMINNWNEYDPFVLNVAGKELVSRVRIADELNRCLEEKINYSIVCPGNKFYENRPKITQMESLYLNKYNILNDVSFTEKIKREIEEIKNEY